MGESSSRAYSLFIIFFILAVGFSLISADIFKDNTAISIDAYAKRFPDTSQSGDTNVESTGTNPTPESSQPNMQSGQDSGSPPSSSDIPSTTTPTDNQKGDQLIPGGGTIPLGQGNNNNNTATSQFAKPPEPITGGDNLTAIPRNNTGIFPPATTLTNQTTTTGSVTNGTATTPITNGTNPQGTGGNTTNISIAIAIAVQNIINRISSGGANNVQLQALIQQLITLLVKQGQANNPNIKFVELQSVPINEYFANNTRLGPQVRVVNHTLLVDPTTGELFAKGIVKNTGTSTIASVNIFADEFDIANHFIQRTQSAPNTIPLKPGDSFNYTIDLRGHFSGRFDSHEIAAVMYQLTAAKNAVTVAAPTPAAAATR